MKIGNHQNAWRRHTIEGKRNGLASVSLFYSENWCFCQMNPFCLKRYNDKWHLICKEGL